MTNPMSMIERVARAILAGHDWTGPDVDSDRTVSGWEHLTPDWQEAYRKMARAAIEAWRDNLTEPMRYAVWFDQYKFQGATDEEASELALQRVDDPSQLQQDVRAHHAMIDAALSEEGE